VHVEVDRAAAELSSAGFAHIRAPHESRDLAWSRARAVFDDAARDDALAADMPPLSVVGQFTIPPPSARRRDFQALHLDFGLPVVPGASDVARFTALYIDRDRARTTALTRIVRLRALLEQRAWVEPARLLERLRRYGEANAPVEGILARLVEAADGAPTLPRSGDALCGLELASLAHEREHFADRGLDLDAVEQRILLRPGELLLLDNLATAHGRVGLRRPLELHQLCVGFRALDGAEQSLLLRRVLAAFERGGT
jgi:hypothetical protein